MSGYSQYKANTIIDLANQLSLDEVQTLIQIFRKDIVVFDQCETKNSTREVESVCLNGHSIQLNLEELPAHDF